VIINANEEILTAMTMEMKKWPTFKIGEIFKKFGPFLRVYTTYIINNVLAQEAVEKCKKKYSKFNTFLENQCNTVEAAGNRFESFLILPVN
jgi:hypothetical protein